MRRTRRGMVPAIMYCQTRFARPLLAPLFLLAAMAGAPAAAQTLSEARALKVGQYLWDEAGVTTSGTLSMTVNIAEQRLYVYRDGRLIGMSTASTGAKGHATPLGDFTILQKNMWHRSNLYSNAPMPYMQRLTWTGIAIHAGHLPGYPASHGCIRLPTAFARRLFGITTLGVPVTIIGANRRPLVKLQFADIEWLAGDEDVVATARPQNLLEPLDRPAIRRDADLANRYRPDDYLIDERVLPPRTGPVTGTPHWVDPAEMAAMRAGRWQPRLPFEPVPQ
ncbi:L,D-transpeptidase family protein [Sphingobium sufflavum]|uniref:L,D-transpeptidase family protein n=1 Tax=Sphingobium sufflavum TaxID=1129547 RepID=UPI001F02E9A0|nr:L,D-transpeptidase family protein [Sphingobium sufflavum]MCE7796970.1 L,D-transpeptidase family protein [Sphingobium sufflavum]